MRKMFKTIEKEAEGIIIQKKSKFIANIFYVENEEEAEERIKEIKKKYYDARHNCYAYRIKTKNGIVQKQSDDGEPSGTAGAPMLNILEKREILNIVVIVTRYFGGILLGTGGLVKAYSDSLKEALQNTTIVEKEEGYSAEIITTYENINQILHILSTMKNVEIIKKEYVENIKITIEFSKKEYEKITENLTKNNLKNTKIQNKKEKIIKLQVH